MINLNELKLANEQVAQKMYHCLDCGQPMSPESYQYHNTDHTVRAVFVSSVKLEPNHFVVLCNVRQDDVKHIIKREFSQQACDAKYEIPDLPGRFYLGETWCGKLAPWIIVENKDETSICEVCLLEAHILWRH